jgi:hypothetical protein
MEQCGGNEQIWRGCASYLRLSGYGDRRQQVGQGCPDIPEAGVSLHWRSSSVLMQKLM